MRAPSRPAEHRRSELEAMGRALGFGPDEVARVMQQQASAPVEQVVDLWDDEAAIALSVVRLTQFDLVAGVGGACYVGVSTSEIQSAAAALGVPFDAGLVMDCRYIARGACDALNRQMEHAR